MRNKAILILSVLVLLGTARPADGAEYYFKFSIRSRKELVKLTRVISIDNVKDTVVFAYANDRQLEEFTRLGYDYTLLPSPGTLVKPAMATERQDVMGWDTYPRFDGYVAMMYQFEVEYLNLCCVYNSCYRVQGRGILFAKKCETVEIEEE